MVEAVVEKMKSIGTQQYGLEWVRFLRSCSSVGRNSIRNSKGERSCFERCRHTTTDPILRIATVRQPWRRLVVVDATAFSTTHLQGTPPSEKSLGVIRELKDVDILKSYLLVIWSEWDTLWHTDFHAICGYVREDFSGIEANSHCADLAQRLDRVIGQLERGLVYLQRDRPEIKEDNLRMRKGKYKRIRKILKEDLEAPEIPTCLSSRSINLFDLLTPVDTYRISLNTHMYAPCPVSGAVGCLGRDPRKHAFYWRPYTLTDLQQNVCIECQMYSIYLKTRG